MWAEFWRQTQLAAVYLPAATPSVVCGPAAAATPGSILEMQTLKSHAGTAESDFYAHQNLRSTGLWNFITFILFKKPHSKYSKPSTLKDTFFPTVTHVLLRTTSFIIVE